MSRRREEEADTSLSLQDLLSNALAAIIVLTMIAMAITGTGKEFFKPPESDTDPGSDRARLLIWTPPEPYEQKETEWVLVQVTVDGTGEIPPLEAKSRGPAAELPHEFSGQQASGVGGAEQLLVLPVKAGVTWSVSLEETLGLQRLRMRVQAEQRLLRDAVLLDSNELCGGRPFLQVCTDKDGTISAVVRERCGQALRCSNV